jgi:hypothetical protein
MTRRYKKTNADKSTTEVETYVKAEGTWYRGGKEVCKVFIGSEGYMGPVNWVTHGNVYDFNTAKEARRYLETADYLSGDVRDIQFIKITTHKVVRRSRRVLSSLKKVAKKRTVA